MFERCSLMGTLEHENREVKRGPTANTRELRVTNVHNDEPMTEGSDLAISDSPSADVKSSVRTLEILELLSQSTERKSVASMARELSIPKSSLHGILRTMERRGWLETDATGTLYSLGLRALFTGTAYVDGDDIVTLTRSILDILAERTGETVHLGRLEAADVIYLAKRESIHALRLYSAVGRRLPAHATALGKVLLAELDPGEVDRRLNWPLKKLTERTITSPIQLRAELDEIKLRGYAVDDGENADGIQCMAVAIRGLNSLNAMSCSVPESRMTEERRVEIISALQDAASNASAVLDRRGRVS
jgi:DNA-binding IclR family transcriptional regulator